jgi:glycerol-1-phosphate dehydrogenase [NAD(P)+]
MIYKQLASLPIIYQVDENIYDKIDVFLKKNNLIFFKILVVSGKKISLKFSRNVSDKLNCDNYILENNSFNDVELLKKRCLEKNIDLIISIGGGKVQDTVKRVSYIISVNHISIPTIISNDGLISPIAVLKNNISNKTESIPAMMPMGVIIDLNIIYHSPIKYIRAAAGDILSNLSATNDWVLAKENNNDMINDISFLMSKSAANSLIYFSKKDFRFKPFIKQIIQGQINSGIAMSLSGNSRPCSGSEHLISHAIDNLNLGTVLHGQQVASISLFILFLQGKLIKDHLKYAVETNIELQFTNQLKTSSEAVLRQIFTKSKEMRPGRYTVLDTISEDLFISKIVDFNNYIKNVSLA